MSIVQSFILEGDKYLAEIWKGGTFPESLILRRKTRSSTGIACEKVVLAVNLLQMFPRSKEDYKGRLLAALDIPAPPLMYLFVGENSFYSFFSKSMIMKCETDSSAIDQEGNFYNFQEETVKIRDSTEPLDIVAKEMW